VFVSRGDAKSQPAKSLTSDQEIKIDEENGFPVLTSTEFLEPAFELESGGLADSENTTGKLVERLNKPELQAQIVKMVNDVAGFFKAAESSDNSWSVDSVQFKLDLSAKTGVTFIGSAEVGASGGLTVTLKRKLPSG
tara:strand:- start:6 stop:416 length:411 start_codon:yes stop_codon:yes gene_type:complete